MPTKKKNVPVKLKAVKKTRSPKSVKEALKGAGLEVLDAVQSDTQQEVPPPIVETDAHPDKVVVYAVLPGSIEIVAEVLQFPIPTESFALYSPQVIQQWYDEQRNYQMTLQPLLPVAFTDARSAVFKKSDFVLQPILCRASFKAVYFRMIKEREEYVRTLKQSLENRKARDAGLPKVSNDLYQDETQSESQDRMVEDAKGEEIYRNPKYKKNLN